MSWKTRFFHKVLLEWFPFPFLHLLIYILCKDCIIKIKACSLFLAIRDMIPIIALSLKSAGFLFCHFMVIVVSLWKSHFYVENIGNLNNQFLNAAFIIKYNNHYKCSSVPTIKLVILHSKSWGLENTTDMNVLWLSQTTRKT